MKLVINGETKHFETDSEKISIQKFLTKHSSVSKDIAVAVNLSFVPKSTYSEYYLKEGDDIEIVTPMQGG